MQETEFKVRSASDPRLAIYATSPLPAWLWSVDGTRMSWANPVGARLFGAASATRLASNIIGPADPRRRQVMQLANRLPAGGAIRMERLRAFGAALGMLATCACARLDFADGAQGILVVNVEWVGRAMPLIERLRQLVSDTDEPIMVYDADGRFVAASRTASDLLELQHLSEAGLEEARLAAMKEGRAEASFGDNQVTMQRVGSGTDLGLLAFVAQQPARDFHIVLMDPFADELPAATAALPTGSDETIVTSTAGHANGADQSPHAEVSLSDGSTARDRHMPPPRRQPLRFMWQMDAEGRFSLGSDAFTRLIGVRTAAGFGRPWREIAEAFQLDPESRVLDAMATRESWSGITLDWPVDDGSHLPVELSGLPIHDAARHFVGYRGFGVCRDLEGLSRLDALRSQEFFNDPPSADMILTENGPAVTAAWPTEPLQSSVGSGVLSNVVVKAAAPRQGDAAQPTEVETPVETHEELSNAAPPNATPPNVIPFRPLSEPPAPVLTVVEDNAFNELARQLSARLEGDNDLRDNAESKAAAGPSIEMPAPADGDQLPNWIGEVEPPPRGESRRDKTLFDLLSTGVLIYRLDRLLYANQAFLERMGYDSLHALEQEGGLDALYVEPGVSNASSTSDTGTPVTISASHGATASTSPIAARLHTISWNDDSAHALIFSGAAADQVPAAPPDEPPAVGHVNAEELAAILDATADGILMFDAEGNINSCNRSAEALFGLEGADLVQHNLAALFAPESRPVVSQYLEILKGAGIASLLEHGREVLGKVRGGGLIPLSMSMGRTLAQGPNFFAVFRDLSETRENETELHEAKRVAEHAAHAKADLLARISHEIRTPLSAIIGFADVMIGERFGALGNERYAEYMKDVRASGEKVIALLDDLANLSRIETGKLDLAFADQNLNDVVESCVAIMQPQASRERIVIRTSLAHTLPPVVADALTLRQITMNLIGNSIHLANTGGQVIVSTALTDLGDVALRIRDTGQGLNDNEVAAAMEPFRSTVPSDQSPESGVSLSLTKALVEANRARFNIKTGTHSGTLVEVVFSHHLARTGSAAGI